MPILLSILYSILMLSFRLTLILPLLFRHVYLYVTQYLHALSLNISYLHAPHPGTLASIGALD
jgi:hypothetical protein